MVVSEATTESRSQHAMHLLPIVIAHTDFQYVYKLLHFGSVYLVIPVFGFDFSTSLSVSNDLRCRAGNVRWSFLLIFFFFLLVCLLCLGLRSHFLATRAQDEHNASKLNYGAHSSRVFAIVFSATYFRQTHEHHTLMLV